MNLGESVLKPSVRSDRLDGAHDQQQQPPVILVITGARLRQAKVGRMEPLVALRVVVSHPVKKANRRNQALVCGVPVPWAPQPAHLVWTSPYLGCSERSSTYL